jgi:hypothetical protein
MLWSDVVRLFEYWAVSPPLRALAGAWMGFKPADDIPKPDQHMTAEAFKMLVSATGNGRTLVGRGRHG